MEKRKIDSVPEANEESINHKMLKTGEDSSSKGSYCFDIHSGAFGNKGLKQHLEDTWTIVPDLRLSGDFPALTKARSAFFALYDGHAGRSAAEFCAEKLHANIASKIEIPGENESVRKAIFDGFKETDTNFLALAASKNYKDGCTAVTVTIVQDITFVAWVGDNKAVLATLAADPPNPHRVPARGIG